jgi:hypothetical protein
MGVGTSVLRRYVVTDVPYKDPEQQREYQRQWVAARRAAWFEGKACELCGSTEGLQLDHRDPATKVSHRIWAWSKARREAELVKCRVLCGPHHRAKSATEVVRGGAVFGAKLTEQDVQAILASDVHPNRLLAEQYGVDSSLIGLIRRRQVWRHVEGTRPAAHPVPKTGDGQQAVGLDTSTFLCV